MKKILPIAILSLFISVGVFAPSAKAGNPVPLTGWAWSSNIGWISFNSGNSGSGGGGPYKVEISTSTSGSSIVGDLSGYAWSSNVGWVSFNITDLSGCLGASKATVNFTTGVVSGWIRVLSVKDGTNGWDGCVELAGTNHVSDRSYNGTQGVTYHEEGTSPNNVGVFKGYSWASDFGWLSFLPNLLLSSPDNVQVDCHALGTCPTPSGALTWTCTQDPTTATIQLNSNSVDVPRSLSVTGGSGSGYSYRWSNSSNPSYTSYVNTNPPTTNFNYTSAGEFIPDVNIKDSTNTVVTIHCGKVTVTDNNSPTASSELILKIGRVGGTLGAGPLSIKKGGSFALGWTNKLSGYTCSPSVTKSGVTISPWTGWTSLINGELNTTSSASPISSAGQSTGLYDFKIKCTSQTQSPLSVESNKVTLQIKSSSIQEI